MSSLTGQIGIRMHSTGFVGRAIERVTRSNTHHVVIAINETHVVSAEPGGAVIRPMSYYPELIWSQFDYTDEQSHHMAVLAASMNRQEYNYLGFVVIGLQLVTKRPAPDSICRTLSYQDRMFCSQMADFCLRKAGIDLFHSEWGMVSPGDFENYYRTQGWLEPALITT